MKRKCLAVGIILLFVGTCIIPAIAQDMEKPLPASRSSWLYVGGSGPGNYTSIQDALDNASDGDTVFVYSGMYNGYYKITKSIRLIGKDTETTILNGSVGSVLVTIRADQVFFSGFTLQNKPIQGACGIGLALSQNVTISHLIIKGMVRGFADDWSENTFLDSITFIGNQYGIDIWSVNNMTISNCFFEGNDIALNHKGFPPSEPKASIIIQGCTFSNNTCGINLNELCIDTHGPTTIEHNTFYSNDYGIVTFNSEGVNVHQNNFIENTNHVGLYRSSPFLLIPMYIKCRQHWSGNYWDNWKSNLPCPLRGTWVLFVGPGLFYQFLHFPFIEFDRQPVKEPYDIPGMS